ncbi:MAG: peptidylprolyl isomerase [Gammaproteobacteria bacterium]|nr:peptidylprolyl isomerase [Gammaproteobacteria bacterium]
MKAAATATIVLATTLVVAWPPARAQGNTATPGAEPSSEVLSRLPAPAPEITEIDRIVAVVNDDVIVSSELELRMRAVREQLARNNVAPPPPEVLEKQVLDRLILDRLQLQIAEQSGIRVDDEALNRQVADIARQNNLTLREFRDILERDGYGFATFREEIRNELMKNNLQRRQVESRIQVTPRDIDNFLATLDKQGGSDPEYHLGHILVAVPEGASPEQIAESRQRAEEILTRLRDGAEFERVAVAESDGRQALDGGDLGWRRASELPTIFDEVVPDLAIGGVSDIVRSPSGFHIIKLIDKRGGERHVITQTHARHILIRTNELVNVATARSRLEQLRTRILGGADFEELARANSDDRGSSVSGGDLGWLNPGDTIPAFEQEMNALAPGQVSEPFETQFGWHIVQVLGRRERDSTDDVRRAQAAEVLRKRKFEEELQAWLRQIRDEAYVEYRLED